jgi:hypothetical protein
MAEQQGLADRSPVHNSAADTSGLELAAAVNAIRIELARAVELAEGSPLQLEVGQIDLEFTVTLTRDVRARGGVRIWVVDLGGSAGQSASSTQKLRITLTAKDATTGESLHVSDSSVREPPR